MRISLAVTVGFTLACGSPGGGGLDAGPVDGGSSSVCDGPSKSPPNLVPNSGFECGEQGWAPQYGTLETVTDARTGSKAVKLTATATGAGQFSQLFVSSASGNTYCAWAWLKGTVSDVRLSVLSAGATGTGGTDTNFSSPVATNTWIRVRPSVPLSVPSRAGDKLYLRFVFSNGKAGDTLIVDDVDVWESIDGKCNETR
jgi:hypothetical protein